MRTALDAMSKRLEVVTEKLAQLQRDGGRPSASNGTKASFAETRLALPSLVAGDGERRDPPQDTRRLRDAVLSCVAANEFPGGQPAIEAFGVLVETQRRLDEILLRLAPPSERPDASGPWNSRLELEISELREWRRSELVRIAGERFADLLLCYLRSVQKL